MPVERKREKPPVVNATIEARPARIRVRGLPATSRIDVRIEVGPPPLVDLIAYEKRQLIEELEELEELALLASR